MSVSICTCATSATSRTGWDSLLGFLGFLTLEEHRISAFGWHCASSLMVHNVFTVIRLLSLSDFARIRSLRIQRTTVKTRTPSNISSLASYGNIISYCRSLLFLRHDELMMVPAVGRCVGLHTSVVRIGDCDQIGFRRTTET